VFYLPRAARQSLVSILGCISLGERMNIKSTVMSVAAILLFLNITSFAQNNRPKVPFIQPDICPFECCQYGKWRARSLLKVFKKEGDDSNVLFTIKPGEVFTAINGNVHVTKLGIMIIDRPFGNIKKGDKIYVLSYRGEGEYDLWYKGHIFLNNTDVWEHGTLKQSPEFVWWVYIINKDGKKGWLKFKNITDSGFQTEDKVDGRDSCS
jgi:hypothetical protein